MIQACVFCLSQDRDLLPLEESLYLTVYPSFKEEYIEYINYLQADKLLKLCWECQVKVYNFKKLLQTAHRCLNTFKILMVSPSGDLPKSESSLHITTVETIDIAPSTPLLLQPKVEQNINDADFKFIVEPLGSEVKIRETISELCETEASVPRGSVGSAKDNNVGLRVVKLEDTPDEDNFNIDTISDSHNDDDISDEDKTLLAVRVEALPSVRPKPGKRVLVLSRARARKSRKKNPPTPAPPKYSKVWASHEQAMSWHREELRCEREERLSCVHECDACERLFAADEELRRHILDSHSEEAGQYTCDMCLYRFPDQTKLEQHMEAHYISYKCKTCSFECRVLTEMQQHVQGSHIILQKSVCIRCKNEFVSKAKLKAHLATCKTYKCVDCDKTFLVKRTYHKHVQTHKLDPDGIYCEVCKIYYKATWYKKHLLTSLKHVSKDSFKHECDICHEKFPSTTRLKLHMFGNHKRPGPHPCKLCPKSYFDKLKLARHNAKVHNVGPVLEKKKNKICETCGKGFSSSTILANHLRTHSGERPWRCAECPASFAQNSSWYTHMKRLHGKTIDRHGHEKTAEKVCCDVCGKEFSTRGGLKQHYDFHHLDKTDFQCETCDKYCRTAQDLQKHALSHVPRAPRDPLPCHTCGKTFKTRGAHTQHIQKKHGLTVVKRPFKCRSCDAAYSVQTNLYMHYKVKHLKLKSSDRVKIKNLFNLDKEVVVIARM